MQMSLSIQCQRVKRISSRVALACIILLSVGCNKGDLGTCACYDYGNGYKEVDRSMNVTRTECESKQVYWNQMSPQVQCSLE